MEQGKKLFHAGDVERALGRLERAAVISPRNGPGHYWLAEIWLAKGEGEQAYEHHRLARRYLRGLVVWTPRLQEQMSRLVAMGVGK